MGLQPEISCKPERTERTFFVAGATSEQDLHIMEDPCIRLALQALDGSNN